MAMIVKSFATVKEVKDFMAENNLGKEDILSFDTNASGFIDILFDDGSISDYASGTNETHTVGDGYRVRHLQLWASGGAGSATIFGGDTITIPDGARIPLDFHGALIGDGTAASNIVVGANTYYYIDWYDRS